MQGLEHLRGLRMQSSTSAPCAQASFGCACAQIRSNNEPYTLKTQHIHPLHPPQPQKSIHNCSCVHGAVAPLCLWKKPHPTYTCISTTYIVLCHLCGAEVPLPSHPGPPHLHILNLYDPHDSGKDDSYSTLDIYCITRTDALPPLPKGAKSTGSIY